MMKPKLSSKNFAKQSYKIALVFSKIIAKIRIIESEGIYYVTHSKTGFNRSGEDNRHILGLHLRLPFYFGRSIEGDNVMKIDHITQHGIFRLALDAVAIILTLGLIYACCALVPGAMQKEKDIEQARIMKRCVFDGDYNMVDAYCAAAAKEAGQ